MRAYERFLKYIEINTQSDESTNTHPSTQSQFVLAKLLVEELKEIGVQDVELTENCYIYGTIPATAGLEQEPVVGFIAHMDTAPAFTAENVNPRIVENYDGKDILLNPEKNILMEVAVFPELLDYVGKSLIVTDGTTLLGADDKAGIAEIMTAAERLIQEGVPHGEIRIGFTPDEEIGQGADLFDVAAFHAEYAYTVDGGALGELEYENFNAASAAITIHGNNIHPGEAKNKMVNASLIAMELNAMLPDGQTPAHTEGYEGFYHLVGMEGEEELAKMTYIIRDHDRELFEHRKKLMADIVEFLNKKYGTGTVEILLKDSYYNMKEKITPKMEIVDRAVTAMRANQVEPLIKPIRGGTDGARLSYMGLPCPNLSAGGHNFHGKFEYVPIESMDSMVDVLIAIAKK